MTELRFVKDLFRRMGQLSPAVNKLFNDASSVLAPAPGTFESAAVCIGERSIAWFPMSAADKIVYYHDQQDGPFMVAWAQNPDRAEIYIREAVARGRDMFLAIFDNFLASVKEQASLASKEIPIDNADELREAAFQMLGRSIAWNINSLSEGNGPTRYDPCIVACAKFCLDATESGSLISPKVFAESVVNTKLQPWDGQQPLRTICVPT